MNTKRLAAIKVIKKNSQSLHIQQRISLPLTQPYTPPFFLVPEDEPSPPGELTKIIEKIITDVVANKVGESVQTAGKDAK